MKSFTPVFRGEKRERNLTSNLSPVKKRLTSIDFSDDDFKINEIELFLKNNKESNITSKSLRINEFDLDYGKKKYDEIKEKDSPYYIVFGYEAYGYIFYTLYKSKTNKIYVIKLTLKAIHSYVEIKNESFFNI
jgi:hypothetical protein